MSVLLTDIPSMLRAIIVDTLSNRVDVELLSYDRPRPLREPEHVDVVLTGAANPHDVEMAGRLLTEWPRSRILVVASSGRDAVMYELHPRKLVLGDLSPRALADVICEGFGAAVICDRSEGWL